MDRLSDSRRACFAHAKRHPNPDDPVRNGLWLVEHPRTSSSSHRHSSSRKGPLPWHRRDTLTDPSIAAAEQAGVRTRAFRHRHLQTDYPRAPSGLRKFESLAGGAQRCQGGCPKSWAWHSYIAVRRRVVMFRQPRMRVSPSCRQELWERVRLESACEVKASHENGQLHRVPHL